MKKHLLLGLALMAVTCLGGLVYESTAATQNANTTGTMEAVKPAGNANMGRRRHRRTRRHRRRGTRKPANTNTH